MKGWHIFLHSLKQVTGNLGGAIKVSAVPYLTQFVVLGLVLGFDRTAFDPAMMMQDGGPSGGFLLSMLIALSVAIFAGLWAAVGWHRFVLLGEEAAGLVPPLKSDRLWAYFVRSIGMFVVMFAAGLALGFVGGFFSAVSGMILGPKVIGLIVWLALIVPSFRISASLPGAALGNGVDFWAGWNATKTANLDILVLAIIATVVNIVVGRLGSIPVLGIAFQFFGGWLILMVGVSILTTLYGHYIEGRSIAGIQEGPNPSE